MPALRLIWRPVVVGLLVLAWLVIGGVFGPLSQQLASVQKNDNALLLGRWLFWPFVPRYGSPSHEESGLWGRVARLVAL